MKCPCWGGCVIGIVCFVQAPYEMISNPTGAASPGVMDKLIKESALAGGGFIVAGTFRPEL